MVSGPVADLLTPNCIHGYKEYKNDNGDILSIRTFVKDDVDMVSVNGVELEVKEFVQLVRDALNIDKEEINYDYYACITIMCTISVILFISVVLILTFTTR